MWPLGCTSTRVVMDMSVAPCIAADAVHSCASQCNVISRETHGEQEKRDLSVVNAVVEI